MFSLHGPSEVDEARENLRVIRETMERSTKHSSLSGLAGVLVGIWAIAGVVATAHIAGGYAAPGLAHHPLRLAVVWLIVLILSALTDFVFNKRRAASVGKRVFSSLGARIAQAAGPAFVVCGVVTTFLGLDHAIGLIFPFWMLMYGIAICAVGIFSVKPVTVLGWAFIAAGIVSLSAGAGLALPLMAISFGGFHIAYGLYTGIARGDW